MLVCKLYSILKEKEKSNNCFSNIVYLIHFQGTRTRKKMNLSHGLILRCLSFSYSQLYRMEWY